MTCSTSLSETSDNKPFLIQNRSNNFIKPSIDKDIKHSIDQLSTHETVTKNLTVQDHIPPFANSQQQPQLLETQNAPGNIRNIRQNAPGNLSVGNYTPYPSHNENPPAPFKNKILNTSKNFKTGKPVDQFINDLGEGFETKLPESQVNINVHLALQQEYECWQLPPIELHHFKGNPSE